MIYLIADTHLHHANIIKYCNRPFANVDEMDNTIISNWNSVVKQEDTVYHLGDFILGSTNIVYNYVKKLNGTTTLIKGNHDHRSAGFWNKLGIIFYKKPITIDGMIFSHQPVIDPELPNIHGHTHENNTNIAGIHVCVSVEQINYTPITLDRVKEMVYEKERIIS